jgi:MFS family permease
MSTSRFTLISLNAALGTTIAGYFFSEMDMLTDYDLIHDYIDIISTTQYLIIIFSIFLSCYIAENYGRKKSFYLGNITAIIGSVCCGLGWYLHEFTLFAIGRVFGACCVGVFYLAVPLYSKE